MDKQITIKLGKRAGKTIEDQLNCQNTHKFKQILSRIAQITSHLSQILQKNINLAHLQSLDIIEEQSFSTDMNSYSHFNTYDLTTQKTKLNKTEQNKQMPTFIQNSLNLVRIM